MILYGSFVSPFTMRVTMGARAKGGNLAPTPFAGGMSSDAYVALNPFAKMPLLVDGEFVLPESAVILEYVNEKLPGMDLLPKDLQGRAQARLLARIADIHIAPILIVLFRSLENPEAAQPTVLELGAALRNLEHFLTGKGPYLVQDQFTIADATLIPFLFFIEAMDRFIPLAALIAECSRLSNWWNETKTTDITKRALLDMSDGIQNLLNSRVS